MARDANPLKSELITLSVNAQTVWYLDRLVETGLYGNNRTEAARVAIYDHCKLLISQGGSGDGARACRAGISRRHGSARYRAGSTPWTVLAGISGTPPPQPFAPRMRQSSRRPRLRSDRLDYMLWSACCGAYNL